MILCWSLADSLQSLCWVLTGSILPARNLCRFYFLKNHLLLFFLFSSMIPSRCCDYAIIWLYQTLSFHAGNFLFFSCFFLCCFSDPRDLTGHIQKTRHALPEMWPRPCHGRLIPPLLRALFRTVAFRNLHLIFYRNLLFLQRLILQY